MDSTQKLNIFVTCKLCSALLSFIHKFSVFVAVVQPDFLQLPKGEIYYYQKLRRNLSNLAYILTLQRSLSCFPAIQTHYIASAQSGNILFLISLITLNGLCVQAVKKMPPLQDS